MKRIFLILFCSFFFLCSKAQWVSIPDTAFGRWLNNNYPTCMAWNSQIGFQMDTSCNGILNAKQVDCSSSSIVNLEGIQYFKSDTFLNCSNNKLINIPEFPLLKYLSCENNQLTILPNLPVTLLQLICHHNQLISLPSLPSSIEYINCVNNKITSLPILPSSLLTLNCTKNKIASLPSLPKAMLTLWCDWNLLPSLPSLPDSLTTLFVSNNALVSLQSLPSSLRSLGCAYNQLTSLPSLPDSLKYIYCAANQLSLIPDLPSTLEDLYFENNSVDSIPFLPSTLINLDCGQNQLIKLPTLPNTLLKLDCGNNLISILPQLPTSLGELFCNGNKIKTLPPLPNSLKLLYCQLNLIDSLPYLPINLENLYCAYNKIAKIPILPQNLIQLDCGNNNINVLPQIPKHTSWLICENNPNLSCLPNKVDSIHILNILGTNIHCMPNRFPCDFYDINPNLLPICDATSGCNSFSNISGNVHQDTVVDCFTDSLQPGHGFSNIKLQLSTNGQVVQQAYAYNLGEYSFDLDSLTSYDISIDTASLPFTIACPNSKNRSIVLSSLDSVFNHQDFGLQCKGADIGVQSIYGRFRPTWNSEVVIKAGDINRFLYDANCATNISGTVTTTFTGAVQYVSPAIGSLTPVVSGNTLTYMVNDFSSLSAGSFNVILHTDTNAAMGSQVCISTVVNSSTADFNLTNNNLTQCFEVVNSFDPNAKEVYPKTIKESGDWLTYTIHFQNTGNDTAYNVFLRDTLSASLDAESFQYLASSNKAGIQIIGNHVVFLFYNINLPDSATNPKGSEGWVQFRIKTKKNLPLGTAVKNQAAIYFDLNPAIYTNVASTNITNGIEEVSELNFTLYPNPNAGQFNLIIPAILTNSKLTISDVLGRVVVEQIINREDEIISLRENITGIYFATINKEQFRKTIKFMVF
jgi:uncharacterized repeat protein (TIGR01451 family)